MSELIWKDPPPTSIGPLNWRAPIVAELESRPGCWAVVEHDVARAKKKPWERLGCETTCRKTRFDLVDVYARWPDEPSPTT